MLKGKENNFLCTVYSSIKVLKMKLLKDGGKNFF